MDINYAGMSYCTNSKSHEISSLSRVYINPYFNSFQAPKNNAQRENISMHVNPNFSNYTPHANKNTSNNVARIFINPNFVKPVGGHGTNQCVNITQHNVSNNEHTLVKLKEESPDNQTKTQIQTVNKSRYSLVRHRAIKIKEENVTEKPSQTIKISKYKSVRLSDIKTNMNKNIPEKTPFIHVRTVQVLQRNNGKAIPSESLNKCTSRYKFIKCKPSSEGLNKTKKIVNRKTINKKNYKDKNGATKKIFKKNNIPCPLFKKFGKCIRNIHGHCEFLHDKKHVTLCRKFLKGVCFNNNCMLSHDLTTKKMPTCYFYLKGMCTKVDCPYIHVKLNENTKICSDFLKGYCEKGKKCINRHVIEPDITKKQVSYKYKNTEKTKVRKKYTYTKKSTETTDTSSLNENSKEEKVNMTDGRYYQDREKWDVDQTTTDTAEVIKPTRCKLGSLPSFIQLP